MVARVKIGSEVVPGNNATARALNVKNTLSRDTVVYPFGDGLWRHAKGTSELGLRTERFENGCENYAAHQAMLIHAPFMNINPPGIDSPAVDGDIDGMKNEIPQPENYGSFAAWIRALTQYAPSQAAFARAVGVSPQRITKYLEGGSIKEPDDIQKFADYAGVPYVKVRLLIDGRPLTEAKDIKGRINQTATPAGAQIGRQWEALHDEKHKALLAEQIRLAIEQQQKLENATRKRAG